MTFEVHVVRHGQVAALGTDVPPGRVGCHGSGSHHLRRSKGNEPRQES